MTALSPSCFCVVLLPEKPGSLVLAHDVVHHVRAKGVVDLGTLLLVGPFDPLVVVKSREGQVVGVDPNGSSPVWSVTLGVVFQVERAGGAQGAKPEIGPQHLGICDVLQGLLELQ